MTLAVVRSLDAPRQLATVEERQEFEQELVDQYAPAMVGAGITDGQVASERSTLFSFIGFLARPVWTATPGDADRYLAQQRKERHLTHATVRAKARTIAEFFEFLIARYQGDIAALTGVVVDQPIDEFNRPAGGNPGVGRVPPPRDDVDALFGAWADALPSSRKYLPAARDYLAASHAQAAIVALIAFHALRNAQVRQLLLTDIGDGRVRVDANTIVMADPVREPINAWLAERARRWPSSANPHLFISSRTAVRTTPVSAAWIIDKVGVLPQKIREDRILNEAIATDGDVRRLSDLFGISVATAERYVFPPEPRLSTVLDE